MAAGGDHLHEGLSTGQVALLFLAGAAVCAVFFSAGYLVGYYERPTATTPVTERVTEPSEIPPVATADSSSPAAAAATLTTSDQPAMAPEAQSAPLRPQPLSSSTGPAGEPSVPAEKTPHVPSQVPAGETPPAAAATGAAGGFNIQVAATTTEPDAVKMVKALTALKYTATILTPEQARAGDNLFRVLVGPYASRDEAVKARDKLIQDGFKQPFIKH